MNKSFLTLLLIAFLAIPTLQAQVTAKDFNKLDKSPLDIALFRGADKEPLVKVIYSRPYKNDREILGGIVKYDEIWRTGANETTEVTFFEDMQFGDQDVAAGTYSLFTMPGKEEWTIILNKDTDTWGSYGYNKEQDVARIKVKSKSLNESVENFTISIKPKEDGATMLMAWDTFYVPVPLSTK